MGLHGTILWVYAATIATYLSLAAIGGWYMWRSTVRTGWLTVRTIDGSWSQGVRNARRAEKVALAASERAPLEIVDGTGTVIGRLGFGLVTERRIAGGG